MITLTHFQNLTWKGLQFFLFFSRVLRTSHRITLIKFQLKRYWSITTESKHHSGKAGPVAAHEGRLCGLCVMPLLANISPCPAQTSELIISKGILLKQWYGKVLPYLLQLGFVKKKTQILILLLVIILFPHFNFYCIVYPSFSVTQILLKIRP